MWNSLKIKWITFLQIILDPWILIFLLATIILFMVLSYQKDTTIITILTFITSIFSAVLGGLMTKQWLDITEERVLVARGKSAIRSLKVLLTHIVSLEKRVAEYIGRYVNKDQSPDIIKICFEEISEKTNVLQEEVLNSIENWTDIIPEANIKTQIGIITHLKEQAVQTNKELGDLKTEKTELEKTKGKSAEEIEELKKKIKEKERELDDTKRQLREKEIKIDYSVLSGVSSSGISSLSDFYTKVTAVAPGRQEEYIDSWTHLKKSCKSCGKPLEKDIDSYTFKVIDECIDCRKKQK